MKLNDLIIEAALPKEYVILRDVENEARTKIPMVKKPVQVWTLIDESKLKEVGLKHHVSAFIEDQFHDWDWKDGEFRFYGHSGARGEKHDLVIVYEK